MSGVVRTWWWAVEGERVPHGELERVAALLRSAPIRAVIAARESESETARALAAALGTSALVDGKLASSDDGSLAWIQAFSGAQIVVLAPPQVVSANVARALGLARTSHDAISIEPTSLSAIDWPSADDRDGRPALVGVDLDWTPPPPAQRRAKFPGGPGSAPSARG